MCDDDTAMCLCSWTLCKSPLLQKCNRLSNCSMQFRTRSRDVLMYTCTHALCVCDVYNHMLICVFVCVWVQECDKKEADCELSAKTSRERYQAKCREMGIKVGSILYLPTYVYVYRFVTCLYLCTIWYAFIHYWLSVYTASFVSLAALVTVCMYVHVYTHLL